MGGRRRAKGTRGAASRRLAPLLIFFLGGSLLTVLALWHWGVLGPRPLHPAPAPDREPAALAEPAVPRAEALAALLEPAARWRRRDMGPPMSWTGAIDVSESLLQWNARVTAGVEKLGLQVLEGQEEIVDLARGGARARLTLIIGTAEEVLATLVVEAARPRETPPAF